MKKKSYYKKYQRFQYPIDKAINILQALYVDTVISPVISADVEKKRRKHRKIPRSLKQISRGKIIIELVK